MRTSCRICRSRAFEASIRLSLTRRKCGKTPAATSSSDTGKPSKNSLPKNRRSTEGPSLLGRPFETLPPEITPANFFRTGIPRTSFLFPSRRGFALATRTPKGPGHMFAKIFGFVKCVGLAPYSSMPLR